MTRVIGTLAVTALALAALPHVDARATAEQPAVAAHNGKRVRATRSVVVDNQTGQARLPNAEELTQMVAQLEALTVRPETLQATTSAAGTLKVDLGGGFAGLMLARPDEGGGFETRCVFTFDEGAEFLGLVVEQQ